MLTEFAKRQGLWIQSAWERDAPDPETSISTGSIHEQPQEDAGKMPQARSNSIAAPTSAWFPDVSLPDHCTSSVTGS